MKTLSDTSARITVHTLRERPALRRHFARFHETAWPAFLQDEPASAAWPALYADFADFQLALVAGRRVVAIGNTIPIAWDGTVGDLPGRIVDVLRRGIGGHRRGVRPTALSALSAVVDPRHRGEGLSARVLRAMARLAARHGLRAFLAPVRPSGKGRYPLVPMERYARWRRPDGAPFDPWLRVHWRLGARLLRIIPRANTVAAGVAAWEKWTGLRFPESGRYIVPGAFLPIRVDRARDRVRYDEANVWMRHPVPRR